MATLKNIFAALVVLGALAVAPDAIAKGKLGFGTEATISGFLKPVLKRVKVASVVPGSPAEAAGLKPGDFIVEANGRAIEGAPAREMADQLKNVNPGERLRLKLKRGSAIVVADIVAGS